MLRLGGGGAPAVAAGLLAVAAAYLVYRPWQLRWGASDAEVAAVMPGDEVLPDARWSATRAVTIAAGPEDVWPWLVQMGAGERAGWYSYDRIDNGGRPSAREIRPELQHLGVGDTLRLVAGAPAVFEVVALEPGRSLALAHRDGGTVTAAFVLTALGPVRSRLVHRVRFRVQPSARGRVWAALMDAGDGVMSRRMLLGVRARAEELARRGGLGRAPRDHRRDGPPLSFDLEVAIRCPPAAAFALLADVQVEAGAPGTGVRMTKIPPGPTAVGTRWHEEVRLLPGLWMPVDSVVTAVTEPDRLEEDFAGPFFTGHLTYTLRATPTGTVLRQVERLRPRLLLRWLAGPMDAGLRPRLLDRLADIRDALESG